MILCQSTNCGERLPLPTQTGRGDVYLAKEATVPRQIKKYEIGSLLISAQYRLEDLQEMERFLTERVKPLLATVSRDDGKPTRVWMELQDFIWPQVEFLRDLIAKLPLCYNDAPGRPHVEFGRKIEPRPATRSADQLASAKSGVHVDNEKALPGGSQAGRK